MHPAQGQGTAWAGEIYSQEQVYNFPFAALRDKNSRGPNPAQLICFPVSSPTWQELRGSPKATQPGSWNPSPLRVPTLMPEPPPNLHPQRPKTVSASSSQPATLLKAPFSGDCQHSADRAPQGVKTPPPKLDLSSIIVPDAGGHRRQKADKGLKSQMSIPDPMHQAAGWGRSCLRHASEFFPGKLGMGARAPTRTFLPGIHGPDGAKNLHAHPEIRVVEKQTKARPAGRHSHLKNQEDSSRQTR